MKYYNFWNVINVVKPSVWIGLGIKTTWLGLGKDHTLD